jgi:L-alanine-DL-glutamate epimerase-like enolase superfamily enzyme
VTAATIARIEAIPVRLPIVTPVEHAGGVKLTTEQAVVRVTDSDGATGIAEATARPYIYGETIVSIIDLYRGLIPDVVVGRSIWDRERIGTLLDSAIAHNPCAKAALDMALTDLAARKLGVGINQLFGGWTDRQEVTQLVGIGSPEVVAETCQKLRGEHGIKSFKVKVGQGIDRDLAVLRRLRTEQPDALVYVDANHAYGVVDALRLLRSFADLDIAWVEEPVSADEPMGRLRVANAGFQILGDESCTTPGEVAREVLAGRSHMISLKLARIGYTLSNRIRGLCESAGIPLVVGTQGETGIGTLANLVYTTAHASTSHHPGELAFHLNLEDDLLVEHLRVEDGFLRIRAGAGNGVEVDEDKLRHYRID